MSRLDRSFFMRDTVEVARDLLGHILVHEAAAQRISGRIVETEAYQGWEDAASHGYRGKTPRNAVMFGQAGVSYVYFIYGNHWMLNVVAKPPDVDYPAAILLRAVEPREGLEFIAQQRSGRAPREWTNGPGRLCKALGIDRRQHGIDVTAPDSTLYFEVGEPVPASAISIGPRVGMGGNVPEPWKSIAQRFWIAGSDYISR
jgi:DNA-3-methyladenine glycosylase